MHIITQANWAQVALNLQQNMLQYITQAKLQSIVIGESGGIDSALTTALLAPVCAQLSIPLIGRSLTIETNTLAERERADAIGKLFCTHYKAVDLTALYHTTLQNIEIEEPVTEDKTSKTYRLRVGNIKARLRMIYLYNLAQQHRGMVMSTDNQTEYMLGFWTLHGDVGDYNPLFGLWKTEVYSLSRELTKGLPIEQKNALQACIDCLPTDGLGITHTDVEQLGAHSYDEVDKALTQYLQSGKNEINPQVIQRHHASQFKRENPYFVSREIAFKNAIIK